jgi:glycosyltransferase involved in cell wall biosynthesis
MRPDHEPKVLLATCGGYWLSLVAQAFETRRALAGLWLAARKKRMVGPPVNLPGDKVRCCQVFHLGMMPFYFWAPQIWSERIFYAFFPIWKAWFKAQPFPDCNVVQAITGFATEAFDRAERIGALKVADCPNSHPVSYYGYWQRECDIWCPGEKVPIPQWMFARMNRELERADVILCPSKFVRDTMITNGLDPDKCFVNPFGVNTGVFTPRASLPVAPRFICVGTICLRKGHQYLFRAFEIVKRRLPEAELICVANDKQDFRKERPKWVGTYTQYLSLSHPKLAELLRTCTAFVLPSCEEGLARVIPEAIGAGLPIIATYESGATTLVEDGVEGVIVRSRNPVHLAEAMIRLAEDRELNQRMGAAAYQKGAVRNTWQDYGDRLLAEYRARLISSAPNLRE